MRFDPMPQREHRAWRLCFFEGLYLLVSTVAVRWLVSARSDGLEPVACDTGLFAFVPYLITRSASYCAEPVSHAAVALYFLLGTLVIAGTLVGQFRAPRTPMALGPRFWQRHMLKAGAVIGYPALFAMWLTGHVSERGNGIEIIDAPLDALLIFALVFFLPALQMMALQPYVKDKPGGLGATLSRPR